MLAEAIRKMHSQRIYHADPHLNNILLQEKNPAQNKVYIIDFDKSTIKTKLSVKQKMKNLYRFHRYLDKMAKKGISITKTDQLRFLKQYFKDYPGPKLMIRNYLRGYSRHQRVHRLGKNLLRVFSLH